MIEFYPKDIENYSNLGACKLMTDDYNGALASFEKAESIDGEDTVVLANIAYTYYLKEDYPNSIIYYKKIVELGDSEARQFAQTQIDELSKL